MMGVLDGMRPNAQGTLSATTITASYASNWPS